MYNADIQEEVQVNLLLRVDAVGLLGIVPAE